MKKPLRVAQRRYAKGGRLTPWARARYPRPSIPLGAGSAPLVPLISSGVAGPLGLLHLPRLWVEGLLAATGRLHPAFAAGSPLFDELLAETIRLDLGALRALLRTPPLPDYLACERWVCARARRLDAGAIAHVNDAIAKAAEDGIALVLREDLRAWSVVHAEALAARGALEPIVPAISSRTAGPLGLDHLPRLWLKNVLIAVGGLPHGYRAGPVRVVASGFARVPAGLDADLYRTIELAMPASVAFLAEELPDYPAFERWVRAHAGRLDVATLARYNANRSDTRPPKAAAEKAYAGWDDPSNWSFLIDDLIDWRLIYDAVTGVPLPSWAAAPRA